MALINQLGIAWDFGPKRDPPLFCFSGSAKGFLFHSNRPLHLSTILTPLGQRRKSRTGNKTYCPKCFAREQLGLFPALLLGSPQAGWSPKRPVASAISWTYVLSTQCSLFQNANMRHLRCFPSSAGNVMLGYPLTCSQGIML
jgi:hypothetical protein